MLLLSTKFVAESTLVRDALDVVLRVRSAWTEDTVKSKLFTDGITNKLVGFWAEDDSSKKDMLLVRVYGQSTDAIIDREAEKRNMLLMSELGCAKPLYAVFANGLCYGYVHGQCLDVDSVRLPEVNWLVAAEMAKIHSVTPKDQCEASIWHHLHNLVSLLPETMSDPVKETRRHISLPSSAQLNAELSDVETRIKTAATSPIVFCHNDLLVGNIVWNRDDGRTFFIDFEYGGFNYLSYDIANHFNEHTGVDAVLDHSLYPDRQYQIQWLTIYLKHSKALKAGIDLKDSDSVSSIDVSDDELEILYADVQRQSILSDLMWGLWSIRQAEVSTIDFDFIAYAISKLEGFYIKKKRFLDS